MTSSVPRGNSATIERLCRQAKVSRAGYYRFWRTSAPRAHDTIVRDAIQRLALANGRHRGYRLVTFQLRQEGMVVNHKRVLRLMRADTLLCLRQRPFVPPTTDSRHGWPVVPNLARGMQLSGLDQLWVADITYIRLLEQFAYLAVILDAFSRRVVGWAMADHLQASLAIDALKMAIEQRKPAPGSLIHHSDRGIQYACSDYTELLAAHDITPSMSRIGNPYDNAKAERFMRTLKTEQIDGILYRDRRQAERSIGPFIEEVYNRQRLHTALSYRTPVQFEAWHRANLLLDVGDAALAGGSATPTSDPRLDPQPRQAQEMD
jgi:transposase InsO family protein